MKVSIHKKEFNGVHEYCTFWDEQIKKAINEGSEIAEFFEPFEEEINSSLAEGATMENIKAYGAILPSSYNDAMERRTFLNLKLYENTYNDLKPLLERCAKVSKGIIPTTAIIPTEKEVGVFSFERAMMSIDAIPKLYSKKHKKYFNLEDGKQVFDKSGNPKIIAENGIDKPIFKLSLDGSEATLEIFEDNGVKQYGSNNKKSFLYKDKVPRPNNAVRLFILLGNNWGKDTHWAGLAGVIIAQYLESVGYSVKITGVMGVSHQSGLSFAKNEWGTRFWTINLKNYEETLDALSLLYVLSDPSFFRIRQFNYYTAMKYYFKDDNYVGLGSMPDSELFEKEFHDYQKKKWIADEPDVLYYHLGGASMQSIEDAKRVVEEIIEKAEQKNKEALEKLGYEFMTRK
jgi:hypothetical protein